MNTNENAQKESKLILQAIDTKLEAFKLDILNEVNNLLDEKLKIPLSNNEEALNILNYPISVALRNYLPSVHHPRDARYRQIRRGCGEIWPKYTNTTE